MIRSLRWKVVGLTMLMVSAVMLAVFAGVLLTARTSLRQMTEEQLHTALDEQFLAPFLPGTQQHNSLPTFVAEIYGDGTVRVSGSAHFNLDNEAALSAIIEAALERDEDSGMLRQYGLRYLRRSGPLSLKIAFADCSGEQQTLHSLVRSCLTVGILAMSALFLCSYFLAGVVTRPAEQAWKAQQRFLSDASHELKTPLTVILSSADLLAESGGADGQMQPYVDNIRAESRRMRTLVENMLTLSRSEGEHIPLRLAPTDLSDLVADTALHFEPVAFEAGRHLNDSIESGISTLCDAEQLRRLLGILLDNAIKYAPADSEIALRLQRSGHHILLEVENGGEPIPAQHLPHLFERFYRADDSRSDHGSFGLGLAIAQSIARQHGGIIRCRSDKESTCFTVTLPLKSIAEKETKPC